MGNYVGRAPPGQFNDLSRSADADMFSIGQNGATPLYTAAEKGNVECVRLLLEKSDNVDAADKVRKARVQECNEDGGTEWTGRW